MVKPSRLSSPSEPSLYSAWADHGHHAPEHQLVAEEQVAKSHHQQHQHNVGHSSSQTLNLWPEDDQSASNDPDLTLSPSAIGSIKGSKQVLFSRQRVKGHTVHAQKSDSCCIRRFSNPREKNSAESSPYSNGFHSSAEKRKFSRDFASCLLLPGCCCCCCCCTFLFLLLLFSRVVNSPLSADK